MKFSTSGLCLALSASCAILLAACGGGGGSDGRPPFTPSTLSSTNAQDVSAQMLAANSAYSDQSSAGSSMVTGVSVNTSRTGLIKGSLQQLYKGVGARSAGNMVTGVQSTEYCTGGGTIAVSGTFADDTTLSNGDRLSMTANNCVEGNIRLNGGISYTFSYLTGTPDPFLPWSATITFVYSQFTIEGGGDLIRANGDLTMAYNQTSDTVWDSSVSSGSLQTVLMSQGTTVGDYTFSDTRFASSLNASIYTESSDFTLTGIIGRLGNTSFSVKTTVPFTTALSSLYPDQGSMTITASDKTTAKVTANGGDSVTIALDKNADGAIDETINTNWTDLRSRR